MLGRLLLAVAHVVGLVCRPSVLTKALDVAGLSLVVGSVWVAFGVPAGLAASGVAFLVVSWRASS